MAIAFKNAGLAVPATITDFYTCPAATEAVIFTLQFSNVDGVNDAYITIDVYDNSAVTTYNVGTAIIVPADTTLIWEAKVTLEANDKLQLTANAAGDLVATAGIMEKS